MTAGEPAPAPRSTLLHATAIAVEGRAALLTGPSGSGKSDLALRLLTGAFRDREREVVARLVSDDQVVVERVGDRLRVRPPGPIAGLVEVRGIGLVSFEHVLDAEARLIVDLQGAGERMPDAGERSELLGVPLPVLRLDAFGASAPAKVVLWLARLCAEDGGGAAWRRPGTRL